MIRRLRFMFVMAVLLAGGPPAYGASADVTVTINRSQAVGTSHLSLGVTHTRYSLDPFADAASVQRAQALLKPVFTYENQHIYGWGTTNPETSPGTYDWRSLDRRVGMMESIGGAPVLTLCCAPDWMTALGTNSSTYPAMPPTPAHYGDFAALAQAIARRYPQVTHFIVWNEMKGFYNRTDNQWDYALYARFYDAVYDALKAVNPKIQVGGPYLVLEGTGTGVGQWFTAPPVSARNQLVLRYWQAHRHGGDFISVDRNVQDYHDEKTYTTGQKLALTHWFGDGLPQVGQAAGGLPIWYAEDHFAGLRGGPLEFQAAGNASMLLHEMLGRASLTLRWDPEPQAGHAVDDSLYTSTQTIGGGEPYPTYYSYRAIHEVFPPGTELYATSSSSPDIEVAASANRALVINKRGAAVTVSVNGTVLTLAPYEVEVLDASNQPIRFQTAAPLLLSPTSGSAVPSSFTVSGTAEPDSKVQLDIGATPSGTATAGNGGQWTITVSGLAPGKYSLSAVATSATRTASAPSTVASVTVTSGAAPVQPTALGPHAAQTHVFSEKCPCRQPRPSIQASSGATLQWTQQIGTSADDRAFATASDTTGVYVAGGTYGALSGSRNVGSSDAFLGKYSTAGAVLWMRQVGGTGDDSANGVATSSGAVYVAGLTDQGLGGQPGLGLWDGFVQRYTQAGTLLWSRQVGTSGDDGITAVTADSSGVFVVGHTDGAFPGQTPGGYDDAFVAHLDTNGHLVWVRQLATADMDFAAAVAVSGSSVYVSGSTAGSLGGQANAGLLDGFVAKYSTAGNLAWTRLIGTSFDDRAAGVAAAGSSVYVVGYAEGPLPGAAFAGIYDGFVRSYDSSGKLVWTRDIGTVADDRATGISIFNGSVDVVGWTRGLLAGAVPNGASDVAALRYATNGRLLASVQAGSSANDEGYGIATDSTGTYLVGETASALTPAPPVGGADAFILKLAFGGSASPTG